MGWFSCKKIWRNGSALECNTENRRVDPALFYFYFCLRKATHGLSNVTLGCFLYSTISTSVPFTPTIVQMSNLTLVETKMDYSV